MKTFKQHYDLYLEFFSSIDGAVKHIDHLEESILTNGKAGVNEALKQIESSIQYFTEDSDYKISTKFDGAPSIIAGLDNNDRFFVASKAIFNKQPRINYTNEDIDKNHADSPGLSEKLKFALKYLPSINMKGIYQMDYMFDNNIKSIKSPKEIDGVKNENKFITFKPNTILYAVSPESEYGNDILNSKIGVAIHIEYHVVNGILKVKKYTSDVNEFSASRDVFLFNVLINKNKNSGSKFNSMLLKDVKKKKNRINRIVNEIDFKGLQEFNAMLKTYINTEIRNGRFLENPALSTKEFQTYMINRYEKAIIKLKSEKGKERKTKEMKAAIKRIRGLRKSITYAFEITSIIASLKNSLIKIFNEITKTDILGNYIENSETSWRATSPEGFALSKTTTEGEAEITKLVNRKEFTADNFNQHENT